MNLKNGVGGEACIIGMMTYISEEFNEHLEKELKKRKIPIQGKHAALFMILFMHNNKMEFKEIADMWRKSKSTLCDITSRYAEEDLLQKSQCYLDKRNVYVGVTEEALKYKDDFDEINRGFLKKASSNLSEEKLGELKFILVEMMKSFI